MDGPGGISREIAVAEIVGQQGYPPGRNVAPENRLQIVKEARVGGAGLAAALDERPEFVDQLLDSFGLVLPVSVAPLLRRCRHRHQAEAKRHRNKCMNHAHVHIPDSFVHGTDCHRRRLDHIFRLEHILF